MDKNQNVLTNQDDRVVCRGKKSFRMVHLFIFYAKRGERSV